jgi:predicted component of type VI protein secretion system
MSDDFDVMLERFHAELEQARQLDDHSEELLRDIQTDIQQLLDEQAQDDSPPPQDHSVIGLLTTASQHFEAEHPNLAVAMRHLCTTLSNMGI